MHMVLVQYSKLPGYHDMVLMCYGINISRWYVLWHLELPVLYWTCTLYIHTYISLLMTILDLGFSSPCPFLIHYLFLIIHLSFSFSWIMSVSCRWYFGTFWLVNWSIVRSGIPIRTCIILLDRKVLLFALWELASDTSRWQVWWCVFFLCRFI